MKRPFDDIDESLLEKVEKNRSRNREHAKKTRLRKKEIMEGMKSRLIELQKEAARLEQLLEESNTANILLCLSVPINNNSQNSPSHTSSSSVPVISTCNSLFTKGNIVEQLRQKVRVEAAIKFPHHIPPALVHHKLSSHHTSLSSSNSPNKSFPKIDLELLSHDLQSMSSRGSSSVWTDHDQDHEDEEEDDHDHDTNHEERTNTQEQTRLQQNSELHDHLIGKKPPKKTEGNPSSPNPHPHNHDTTPTSLPALPLTTTTSTTPSPQSLYPTTTSVTASVTASDTSDLDLELQRRERNRLHAKLTRDRKKLFALSMQDTISQLEGHIASLQQQLARGVPTPSTGTDSTGTGSDGDTGIPTTGTGIGIGATSSTGTITWSLAMVPVEGDGMDTGEDAGSATPSDDCATTSARTTTSATTTSATTLSTTDGGTGTVTFADFTV